MLIISEDVEEVEKGGKISLKYLSSLHTIHIGAIQIAKVPNPPDPYFQHSFHR